MDQPTDIWEHCLEHAALSDVGLRRANNQDAMSVVIAGSQEAWRQRGHLFMVADGMGAHAAGELASKLAVDAVSLTYFKLSDLPPAEALATAVHEANGQIHGRGQADPEFKGMGTTGTAMLLMPEGAVLAHVGDSRAYRLRGDRLEQLTFDHSLVWEMREAGQLSADVNTDHIPKNIITRSLGPNPTVQVDTEGPFPIAVGDSFLLCSDGLSGPVEDDEMGTILGCMSPDEAVRALVNLGNLRGGPDNITVIVARVVGPLEARENDTQTDDSPPHRTARPVHPALWTVMGVLAMAAAGAAVMQHWPAMAVGLVGAMIAALIALVGRYGGTDDAAHATGRPLGRGPYTACTCRPDGEFVGRIHEIVDELRDAAVEGNWLGDRPKLDAMIDRAKSAETSGNHATAVRECFQAIDFLMGQLKEQSRGDRDTAGPAGDGSNVFD
ncbi:MAG: PP2C family serine/threonine-protein phosphatase [Thermoguttaceae bacterium]